MYRQYDNIHQLAIVALFAFVLLLPQVAMAQSTSSVANVLCTIVSWFQGPIGRSIAMLGVVALGVAAMFGRIQVGSVLVVLTGIGIIFGAQGVLKMLGLNASCTGCTSLSNLLNSPLAHVLGCLAAAFNGSLAKALATLAIITLGLFAMNGRVSYHQAIVTAVGIAAIFGGGTLINSLGVPVAGHAGSCSPTTANFNLSIVCAYNTAIEQVFCNLIDWFNGPIGKGLAVLIIVTLGLMALFAKISYEKAALVGVGIAAMMGATTIVDSMGAGDKGGSIIGCPRGVLEREGIPGG